MKAFFEDPAQLVGAPLLVVGALGLAVAAVALLFAPSMPSTATVGGPTVRHGVPHPTIETFAGIVGLVGGLTVVELLLFAFGIDYPVFVGILFGMTVLKVSLVTMFFFYLKFDSRMFGTVFLSAFTVVAGAAVIIVSAIVGNTI